MKGGLEGKGNFFFLGGGEEEEFFCRRLGEKSGGERGVVSPQRREEKLENK